MGMLSAQTSKKQYSHPHCGCAQKPVGAKGFGLFTCQDLKKGQFLTEYLGEVQEMLFSVLLAFVIREPSSWSLWQHMHA